MGFSQTAVSNVQVTSELGQLFVSWNSTTTGLTYYQVYVNRTLAWWGRSTRCFTPIPPEAASNPVAVAVGSVDPSNRTIDFSGMLPAAPGLATRATLKWSGGSFLESGSSGSIAGYSIFIGSGPGKGVSFTNPIGVVPAYPGGWITDGFGLGGFGSGGFGCAATSYTWTSPPLSSGGWNLAVAPFDASGNTRLPGQTTSVLLQQPPSPPQPAQDGSLLAYQYLGPAVGSVVLTWQPSPS
jgi:hypothetical protein